MERESDRERVRDRDIYRESDSERQIDRGDKQSAYFSSSVSPRLFFHDRFSIFRKKITPSFLTAERYTVT